MSFSSSVLESSSLIPPSFGYICQKSLLAFSFVSFALFMIIVNKFVFDSQITSFVSFSKCAKFEAF